MQLRVASYNIHKCIGGLDRRYVPERIVATLAHYQPDIALLQECANGSKRREWDRQIDLLGDALDLPHRSWVPNHEFRRGGEYGNAILTRFPIQDTENIVLSDPRGKTRSVLHAKLRIRDEHETSHTFHAFCLHLGLTERARDRQLGRFLACKPFARLHHDTPILVAGDFNDVWGSVAAKHLEPLGFQASPRLRTFPAWAPVQALDAIYVRGAATLESTQRGRIAVAKAASDHLPLVADIHLPTARTTSELTRDLP